MDGEIVIDAATPSVVIRLNISADPVESRHFAPDAIDTESKRTDVARKHVVLPTRALGKIAVALGRNAAKAA
jgi:hypothetical protein